MPKATYKVSGFIKRVELAIQFRRRFGWTVALFPWNRKKLRSLDFEWAKFEGSSEFATTLSQIRNTSTRALEVNLQDGFDRLLNAVLVDCYSQLGVWPFSFSYPKAITSFGSVSKSRLLARTIPGRPYTYDTYKSYLNEYKASFFGLTHKKGGWDCFRHLEILFCQCVPLMPDATNIPTNSMVHYPKALLAEIWQSFQRHPGLPSLNLIKHLTDHFNRFLTAHAMAKYVLDRARANKARRVLFIDETLTLGGAYSSVMTLVGLLQIDELEVSTLQSVEHIWSDWKGNSSSFYGRGFGYCGVLDPSLRIRQRSMKVNAAVELLRREYFDLVIFPTIARNNRLYGHFRRCINPQSTVLIHEEDLPPTPAALEELRQSQAVVFVRSLT